MQLCDYLWPAVYFEERKIMSSALISWLSVTPHTGTQQIRSEKMRHLPAAASQALAASISLRYLAKGEFV
jgi:hypothetical protein